MSTMDLKTSVSVFIFIGIFCAVGCLKCYRCLSLECPDESEELCNEVRLFALNQFTDFYYMDNTLPDCPKPKGELDKWHFLQTQYPSTVPCGALQENEATCTLGRFQVRTNIVSANRNVTSHGTVMGCARRKLLDSTVIKFKYVDPKAKGSNSSGERQVIINKCAIFPSRSNTNDGLLRHYMELEHCSKYTDMCYTSSFCIPPENSVVKHFQEQEYKAKIPVFLIFVIVGIIGLVIGICAFLGVVF